MAGEFDFIHWVRRQQSHSDIVRLAAGDDLALLKWPTDELVIVGVDQVLEGVHFDLSIHTPEAVGAKVMNRNLSDCGAMGCLPAAAVATVALPKSRGLDFAKHLYLGMKSAADLFSCHVVGGDTGTWTGPLVLTVTILGRAHENRVVRRSGAKPGDTIYVTGPLGGSILGRHMTFVPRVREGFAIAQSGNATAMIDLSDGLSRDLAHLCRESNVGATLDPRRIPIHPDATTLSHRTGHPPLHHALHDGEDYELLFTGRNMESFGTPIGTVTTGNPILLDDGTSRHPLTAQGWEHQLSDKP